MIGNSCIDADALKFIVKALEKQIPEKPTHECTLIYKFTCPRCKNVHEIKTPYCCFCGQKIDWE
jgi:hypothetical protein